MQKNVRTFKIEKFYRNRKFQKRLKKIIHETLLNFDNLLATTVAKDFNAVCKKILFKTNLQTKQPKI